jgi:HEAT repeat protein
MDSIDSQIARVKQKLAHLQDTWQTRLNEFGVPNEFSVKKHQFRMNATLSEGDLQAFETDHGIRLPEDYRAFLSAIGNGGAGPYYGINSLDKWASGPEELDGEALRQSCPLSEHLPRTTEWEQMLPPGVQNPYQGTITICDLGFKGYTGYGLLIVSGPARGRVVYIDIDMDPPYFLREPDFLSWYERWLDEMDGGYDVGWFGYLMGGSEVDLLRLVEDSHTPGHTRSEALEALTKLPQLKASTPAVLAGLQDADAQVRKSAALVVAHFSLAAASPVIHRLVTDADPAVRESALKALVALPDVPWSMVQGMMRDPHADVRVTAWRSLLKAQRLTMDAVLLALVSDNPELRESAAHSLEDFPGDQALDALFRCLQDPNARVRLSSVQSLSALRSRKSVPILTKLLATEEETLVLGNIIRALAAINDRGAVPALIDATRHSFAGVRYDAATALATLGDRRAIPALRGLRHDTVRPEEWYRDGGHHKWPDRVCDQARRSLQVLERPCVSRHWAYIRQRTHDMLEHL